jgi:membrane protein DedA with SNARE-associated domain
MTTHLTNWIADHGLIAIFVLMAIDSLLPVGGELVMLFAGALAAGAIGADHGPGMVAAVLVGTLGYLAGSLIGWAIGKRGGRAFIHARGHWLHVGPERFDRAERWFGRYGSWFVFFGRLTPLVRSFVAIPAGVLEFPLERFIPLTAAAALIWSLAFALAGHALGANWDEVHHAFRYADYAALVLVVLVVVALLVRTRRRRMAVR